MPITKVFQDLSPSNLTNYNRYQVLFNTNPRTPTEEAEFVALQTTLDASLVNAANMNEIISDMGLITSLTTTVKTSLVLAVNWVVSIIGDLASLTTTVKTDIVSAINSHLAEMAKFENITADLQYCGEVSTEAMTTSIAFGNILYLASTGYSSARAEADTKLPCVAMCVETGSGNRKVLKKGYVRNDTWSFTKGALLYVSTTTAGDITATKPTASTNRVQIIGQAVASNIIYFNPQMVWIEVA